MDGKLAANIVTSVSNIKGTIGGQSGNLRLVENVCLRAVVWLGRPVSLFLRRKTLFYDSK